MRRLACKVGGVPPQLSVVVPVHNVEKYLEACLVSLAEQTLGDIEIVVVDDGSPDRSGQIADRLAAADPRFLVLHTPNAGVSAARNTGVHHASGEYLAFADPDDLVPPRAYERMVETLKETGSDFAAGNAWRFAEGYGTVQSWTHGQAFWRDRLETSIHEFHPLLRDRMVWNKVYRRSFWEGNQLSFPPMKYEDYPVAMEAHLLARKVDVLSDKVYMWRNRESGDSITQQLGQLTNARDRVRSAEMVLDIFRSHHAEPDLMAAVQSYLIDIDVVALATGLTLTSPSDLPEIERLANELALLLDPQDRGTTRLARIIHSALREGDFDSARLLAEWRRRPDRRRLVSELVRRRNYRLLPRVVDAVVPRMKAPKLLRPRRLRSELISFDREPGHFLVVTETKLSAGFVRNAHVTARLVSSEREVELETRMAPTAAGFRLSSRLPLDLVYLLGEDPSVLTIHVSSGGVRWRGTVPAPSPLLPCPLQGTLERWLMPSAPGGQLGMRVMAGAAAARMRLLADALEICVEGAPDGRLVITRPAPTANLVVPAPGGRGRISYEDLVVDDPADNPFSGRAYRGLGFVFDKEGPIDGTHVDEGVISPLVLSSWPASVEWREYLFEVHADGYGGSQLCRSFLPADLGAAWLREDLSDTH